MISKLVKDWYNLDYGILKNVDSTCQKDQKTVKVEKHADTSTDVVCSYLLTWTKIYVILILWGKYVFDVYFAYIRQFGYLNNETTMPEELKPYYSDSEYEEAKVHCMFKSLINLENKYHNCLRLTVMYLTNIYCTMWWFATKISSGRISRVVSFQVMQNACNYKLGDMMRHMLLISSSCSTGEGACRICTWVKDIVVKCWSSMASLLFVEEVLLAIILTLMTTPLCVVLFLLYRIYRTFLLPHFIQESTGHYIRLEQGKLYTMIQQICEKANLPMERIYISCAYNNHLHNAKIRGHGEKRYLVLGLMLINGHVDDVSKTRSLVLQNNDRSEKSMYSLGEVAAVIARAQNEYTIAVPSREIILEATRWLATITFTVFLACGFLGGSRLGFRPSPPQTIAFTMSKHISIPIFTVVQLIKNFLNRRRNRTLDDIVCSQGMGGDLMSFIGKEAKNTMRCPIEDPLFTWVYSSQHSPANRIQHLKKKLTPPDAAVKK